MKPLALALSTLTLLAVGLARPADVDGKPDGAAPGFAGDLVDGGQPRTCRVCHTGNALNDASGGSMTLTAPQTAAPGETVTITVEVDNAAAGSPAQGFQAIVKDPAEDAFVGSYTVPDPGAVKVVQTGGDEYVTHTGPGRTAWSFQWTAPTSGVAEVVVYAAANAANGNGTTSGDFIFRATQTIALGAVAGEDGPAPDVALAWSAPSPNPARGVATARLTLDAPRAVEVSLVDGRGRRVRAVASGAWERGETAVTVDLAGLAPGLYFLVAETAEGRRAQPVSVVR